MKKALRDGELFGIPPRTPPISLLRMTRDDWIAGTAVCKYTMKCPYSSESLFVWVGAFYSIDN